MFGHNASRQTPGDVAARERAWMQEPLSEISTAVLELADAAVTEEMETRGALNARVAGTMTFAGALLAAAFALSKNAADLGLDGAAETVFGIIFAGTVALLVAVVLLCVSAVRIDRRHRLNPELLRWWARERVADAGARVDRFKYDVVVLERLNLGNERRARRLTQAQWALGGALLLAAAGALIVFFGSPELPKE